MTLKYLGPWDPGILGLLDLSLPSSNTSYFLLPPLTSSDLLLSLPPTLLLLYGLVWAWLSVDIGDDVKKLWGGGLVVVGCTLDYSSGPFLSYEIEIGD